MPVYGHVGDKPWHAVLVDEVSVLNKTQFPRFIVVYLYVMLCRQTANYQ